MQIDPSHSLSLQWHASSSPSETLHNLRLKSFTMTLSPSSVITLLRRVLTGFPKFLVCNALHCVYCVYSFFINNFCSSECSLTIRACSTKALIAHTFSELYCKKQAMQEITPLPSSKRLNAFKHQMHPFHCPSHLFLCINIGHAPRLLLIPPQLLSILCLIFDKSKIV